MRCRPGKVTLVDIKKIDPPKDEQNAIFYEHIRMLCSSACRHRMTHKYGSKRKSELQSYDLAYNAGEYTVTSEHEKTVRPRIFKYRHSQLNNYLMAYDIFALAACGVWANNQKRWDQYGDGLDLTVEYKKTKSSYDDEDAEIDKMYNQFFIKQEGLGANPIDHVMNATLKIISDVDPEIDSILVRRVIQTGKLFRDLRQIYSKPTESAGAEEKTKENSQRLDLVQFIEIFSKDYFEPKLGRTKIGEKIQKLEKETTHVRLLGFGSLCTLESDLSAEGFTNLEVIIMRTEGIKNGYNATEKIDEIVESFDKTRSDLKSDQKRKIYEVILHGWLKAEIDNIRQNNKYEKSFFVLMLKYIYLITIGYNRDFDSRKYMIILKTLEVCFKNKDDKVLPTFSKGIITGSGKSKSTHMKMNSMIQLVNEDIAGKKETFYFPYISEIKSNSQVHFAGLIYKLNIQQEEWKRKTYPREKSLTSTRFELPGVEFNTSVTSTKIRTKSTSSKIKYTTKNFRDSIVSESKEITEMDGNILGVYASSKLGKDLFNYITRYAKTMKKGFDIDFVMRKLDNDKIPSKIYISQIKEKGNTYFEQLYPENRLQEDIRGKEFELIVVGKEPPVTRWSNMDILCIRYNHTSGVRIIFSYIDTELYLTLIIKGKRRQCYKIETNVDYTVQVQIFMLTKFLEEYSVQQEFIEHILSVVGDNKEPPKYYIDDYDPARLHFGIEDKDFLKNFEDKFYSTPEYQVALNCCMRPLCLYNQLDIYDFGKFICGAYPQDEWDSNSFIGGLSQLFSQKAEATLKLSREVIDKIASFYVNQSADLFDETLFDKLKVTQNSIFKVYEWFITECLARKGGNNCRYKLKGKSTKYLNVLELFHNVFGVKHVCLDIETKKQTTNSLLNDYGKLNRDFSELRENLAYNMGHNMDKCEKILFLDETRLDNNLSKYKDSIGELGIGEKYETIPLLTSLILGPIQQMISHFDRCHDTLIEIKRSFYLQNVSSSSGPLDAQPLALSLGDGQDLEGEEDASALGESLVEQDSSLEDVQDLEGEEDASAIGKSLVEQAPPPEDEQADQYGAVNPAFFPSSEEEQDVEDSASDVPEHQGSSVDYDAYAEQDSSNDSSDDSSDDANLLDWLNAELLGNARVFRKASGLKEYFVSKEEQNKRNQLLYKEKATCRIIDIKDVGALSVEMTKIRDELKRQKETLEKTYEKSSDNYEGISDLARKVRFLNSQIRLFHDYKNYNSEMLKVWALKNNENLIFEKDWLDYIEIDTNKEHIEKLMNGSSEYDFKDDVPTDFDIEIMGVKLEGLSTIIKNGGVDDATREMFKDYYVNIEQLKDIFNEESKKIEEYMNTLLENRYSERRGDNPLVLLPFHPLRYIHVDNLLLYAFLNYQNCFTNLRNFLYLKLRIGTDRSELFLSDTGILQMLHNLGNKLVDKLNENIRDDYKLTGKTLEEKLRDQYKGRESRGVNVDEIINKIINQFGVEQNKILITDIRQSSNGLPKYEADTVDLCFRFGYIYLHDRVTETVSICHILKGYDQNGKDFKFQNKKDDYARIDKGRVESLDLDKTQPYADDSTFSSLLPDAQMIAKKILYQEVSDAYEIDGEPTYDQLQALAYFLQLNGKYDKISKERFQGISIPYTNVSEADIRWAARVLIVRSKSVALPLNDSRPSSNPRSQSANRSQSVNGKRKQNDAGGGRPKSSRRIEGQRSATPVDGKGSSTGAFVSLAENADASRTSSKTQDNLENNSSSDAPRTPPPLIRSNSAPPITPPENQNGKHKLKPTPSRVQGRNKRSKSVTNVPNLNDSDGASKSDEPVPVDLIEPELEAAARDSTKRNLDAVTQDLKLKRKQNSENIRRILFEEPDVNSGQREDKSAFKRLERLQESQNEAQTAVTNAQSREGSSSAAARDAAGGEGWSQTSRDVLTALEDIIKGNQMGDEDESKNESDVDSDTDFFDAQGFEDTTNFSDLSLFK